MAHNISRSKKAAYIRSNRVSLYAGFNLECSCGGCRQTRAVPVDGVLTRLGPAGAAQTVQQVIMQLRCRECRRPPADVVLATHLIRLHVWGSAAFGG